MRHSDLKLRYFAKMADQCLKNGQDITECSNEVVQALH